MTDAPSQVDILKIWRYLAIFAAALIIHSLIRFFLAPEPIAFTLTIGSALVFLPLLWLSLGKSIESLRRVLESWQWLIFLLLLIAGILLGCQEQRDLLYIHANLVYWPFALLFYSQIYTEKQLSLKSLLLISILLIATISLIRVLALSYYPRYQLIDEPWVFSYLINYLRTGILADPLLYNRPIDLSYSYLPMAYWLGLFEPSLWIGRLYNFFLFFPFVALLGFAAWQLYGKRAAFFSTFAAFGLQTLYASTHLRHDLSFMLFIAAAFAAYAYALKKQSWFWHSIAGLITGLSLIVHYHAAGMGLMLSLGFYLPLYLAKRRGEHQIAWSHFLAFVLGGLLGAGIIFVISILPSWSGFVEARNWRGITHPIQFPILYIQYIYLARPYLFEQLLSIGAVAMLFYKAKTEDKVLIWLYFLGPAILAIVAGGGFPHYTQHIAPVYALIIGRGLMKFLDLLSIKQVNLALATGLLVLSPLIGNSTPLSILEEQRPLMLEEPASVTWIKANIPAGSVIVGPNWYYLFLYQDYQYYSDRSWDSRSDTLRAIYNADEALFWDEVNPDVVIRWEKDLMNPYIDLISIDEDYLLERGYERVLISELMPVGNDIDEVTIFRHP